MFLAPVCLAGTEIQTDLDEVFQCNSKAEYIIYTAQVGLVENTFLPVLACLEFLTCFRHKSIARENTCPDWKLKYVKTTFSE